MGRPAIDLVLRLLGAAGILALGFALDRPIPGAALAGLVLAPLAWIGASVGKKMLLLALWVAIGYVASRNSVDPDDGQYGFWVIAFVIWTVATLAGTGVAVLIEIYVSTRRRIGELEAGPRP